MKFLLFNLFVVGGETAESLIRGGSSGRISIWTKTLTDISHKPLLGYGPMHFAILNPRYNVASPSNSLLHIIYEFGIPAAIIAAGLVAWALVAWFKQHHQPEPAAGNVPQKNTLRPKMNRAFLNMSFWPGLTTGDRHGVRIGISTALLAGLGYSLLSGVIVMPFSQLWMALIAGWALGIYWTHSGREKSNDKQQHSHQPLRLFKRGVAGLIILAAVGFMSYSLAKDVSGLKENRIYYEMHYSLTLHPRFWLQGKILPPVSKP